VKIKNTSTKNDENAVMDYGNCFFGICSSSCTLSDSYA